MAPPTVSLVSTLCKKNSSLRLSSQVDSNWHLKVTKAMCYCHNSQRTVSLQESPRATVSSFGDVKDSPKVPWWARKGSPTAISASTLILIQPVKNKFPLLVNHRDMVCGVAGPNTPRTSLIKRNIAMGLQRERCLVWIMYQVIGTRTGGKVSHRAYASCS